MQKNGGKIRPRGFLFETFWANSFLKKSSFLSFRFISVSLQFPLHLLSSLSLVSLLFTHTETELTRQVTLPTENGHAAPPVESRKSCESVNPYCVSEPGEFSRVEAH